MALGYQFTYLYFRMCLHVYWFYLTTAVLIRVVVNNYSVYLATSLLDSG